MKATEQLHQAGQSLWLDNITRGLLEKGTLARYLTDYSITGLTSNPSIFDKPSKPARTTTPTSPPTKPAAPPTSRCSSNWP